MGVLRHVLGVMTGMVLLLSAGCETFDSDKKEDKKEEKPPERSKYSILVEPKSAVITEPIQDPVKAITQDVVKVPDIREPIANAVLSSADRKALSSAAVKPVTNEDIYEKLFAGQDDSIKVAINFDAAPLADVLPAFAQALKFQYILDPEVKGSITMSVDTDMKRRDVWKLFEQILWMTGSYCALENKVLHIRPSTRMAQERKFLAPGSNVEARLYPLRATAAKDIAPQLKPFLSEAGTVNALDGQNALMLVETSENLTRLLALAEALDRRPRNDWPYIILTCNKVASSKIQQELMDILPVLGFPVSDSEKNNDPGAIQLMSIDRMQVIVASAATPEPLEELKKWVNTLDRTDTGEQERVFIYKVINGKADELMQALSVIFPTEGTSMSAPQGESGEASAKQVASKNQNANQQPSQTNSGRKSKSGGNNSNVKGGDGIFDVPVKIFADGVHNRLVVRTTPRTYGMMHALLERLDTIPAQVLLQVLVVEIELTDSNEFGMEFSETFKAGNTESIYGTNYTNLAPTDSKQVGGKYYIYNPDNPSEQFGYIKALAGKTKMKVISSPQILAVSHTKAKISVGKDVPIITNEITDTASSSTTDTSLKRSYQYQSTGVILTVTPHITKGGLISMDLEQVISEAVTNTTKGIDSPIIKKDELKTTMSLRNGRTIIMGGMIKEKFNENLNSVPFLVNIPVLSYLTGDSNSSLERTEILVMVSATIIDEKTPLEDMIRRYRNAVEEVDYFENRIYKEKETKKGDKKDDKKSEKKEAKKEDKKATGSTPIAG